MCRTDLFRKADHDKMASVITDWAQWMVGQSAESGALAPLYCATAPELEGEWMNVYMPVKVTLAPQDGGTKDYRVQNGSQSGWLVDILVYCTCL